MFTKFRDGMFAQTSWETIARGFGVLATGLAAWIVSNLEIIGNVSKAIGYITAMFIGVLMSISWYISVKRDGIKWRQEKAQELHWQRCEQCGGLQRSADDAGPRTISEVVGKTP